MNKKNNEVLVSVYGSLRANMGNHRLLENSTFVGTFTTPPVYTMYSLGGFPALKENGNTPIIMEVYSVTPEVAKRLDQLEGYDPKSNDNNFYDKKTIETPYGEAGLYLYVPNTRQLELVESGDWKEFYENKRFTARY